ncbi:hypothetical protein PMAYCL1PPCAC_20732, partial [Pristionchus mayeri]
MKFKSASSLSAQSRFFAKLFDKESKRNDICKILIEDVEFEEFFNIYKMIYGFIGATLNGIPINSLYDCINSNRILLNSKI